MKKCIDCEQWIDDGKERGCKVKFAEQSDIRCVIKNIAIYLFYIVNARNPIQQKAEKLIDKITEEMKEGDEWKKK